MRSFISQKQETNCNCFDTSPKTNRRIFLSDSNTISHKKQPISSYRNQSQQGKHKKKSLKKQRPYSINSQRSIQRQQESFLEDLPMDSNKNIPLTQKVISLEQKEQNYEFLQFNKVQQLKSLKIKQSTNLRQTRGHQIPIMKGSVQNSNDINSQLSVRQKNKQEYECQISQEFKKDLQEFKLNMDKLKIQQKRRQSKQPIKKNINNQKQRGKEIPFSDIIKKPSRKNSLRTPQKANSYRENKESQRIRQTISKKERKTMIPKQIESQNDSNQSQASEFIGRGWDGSSSNINRQQQDFGSLAGRQKKQTIKTETMVTRQSNIRNSQIKTINGEHSHILTSARSQNFTAFPFGQNKYGQAGLSYQHISDLQGQKNTHAKIRF